MKNFWSKLPKPFFCLAPMADVTDVAFREIITKYSKFGGDYDLWQGEGKFTRPPAEPVGGPDVMWTEFVSADGLCNPVGREKLLIDLAYTEAERPIVAQLFTSKPENMRAAASLIRELGFDGLDINMGCPDRKVEKQGAGAALIKDFKLAEEIVAAAKEGVEEKIPISVKTRIGYNTDILDEWLSLLLETQPAAVTVHARTRKEMSKAPARWEAVARAVKLRDQSQSRALIIGNGDVKDLADAKAKARETGADGIMLGRAIFGHPFLFRDSPHEVSVSQRLDTMMEHTRLFEKLLGGKKNFSIMKKHYKAYAQGFDGAKELRAKLMETKNANEVEAIVKKFLRE